MILKNNMSTNVDLISCIISVLTGWLIGIGVAIPLKNIKFKTVCIQAVVILLYILLLYVCFMRYNLTI